jgi:hypothetical protein
MTAPIALAAASGALSAATRAPWRRDPVVALLETLLGAAQGGLMQLARDLARAWATDLTQHLRRIEANARARAADPEAGFWHKLGHHMMALLSLLGIHVVKHFAGLPAPTR